jgi:hypothetical protein
MAESGAIKAKPGAGKGIRLFRDQPRLGLCLNARLLNQSHRRHDLSLRQCGIVDDDIIHQSVQEVFIELTDLRGTYFAPMAKGTLLAHVGPSRGLDPTN